ncbi:hypothetical protein OAM69_02905 [bacterium]|nr:hypothetical protein [bacterium]
MSTLHNSGGPLLIAIGRVLGATHTALSIFAVIFLLSLVVLDYFSVSLSNSVTESKYRKVFDSGVTSFHKTRHSSTPQVVYPDVSTDAKHIGVMRGPVSEMQDASLLETELAYIDAEFQKLQIWREQLLRIIAERHDNASQTDANTIVMMEPVIER